MLGRFLCAVLQFQEPQTAWAYAQVCVVLHVQVVQKAADIQDAISEGANSFLFTEYRYLGVFMVRGACAPQLPRVDQG